MLSMQGNKGDNMRPINLYLYQRYYINKSTSKQGKRKTYILKQTLYSLKECEVLSC